MVELTSQKAAWVVITIEVSLVGIVLGHIITVLGLWF